MTAMQIQARVIELVASIEQFSKLTKSAAAGKSASTLELAQVTSSLATELATLLGKGRLEVEGGVR